MVTRRESEACRMRHKSGANRPFNGCSSQPRWSRPWLSLVCLGKLGFAVGHTRWVTRAGSALKIDKTRVKGKGPTRDGRRTPDWRLRCVRTHVTRRVTRGPKCERRSTPGGGRSTQHFAQTPPHPRSFAQHMKMGLLPTSTKGFSKFDDLTENELFARRWSGGSP